MYPMSSSSGSYAGCCWRGEGTTWVHDVMDDLRSNGVATAGPQSVQRKRCSDGLRSTWGANSADVWSLTLLSTIQRHLRSWQRPRSQCTQAPRSRVWPKNSTGSGVGPGGGDSKSFACGDSARAAGKSPEPLELERRIARIGEPSSGIRDSGFGTRDAGRGTQDSGHGTRDSGRGTQDSEHGTRDSGHGIRDTGFGHTKKTKRPALGREPFYLSSTFRITGWRGKSGHELRNWIWKRVSELRGFVTYRGLTR
jgi:hypothetical protein